MPLDDAFWSEERQTGFEALFPTVQESVHQAVANGWDMLQADIDVDWRLVNQQANLWAQQYTYELVSQLDNTTRALLQSEISDWVQAGDELSVLIDSLQPTWGPVRAAMIGVTETTRVFAEGNRLAWLASGVVPQVRWFTAYDNDVCTTCEPLNTKVADINTMDFEGLIVGGPPAHTRCRCWIQPVVDADKWLQVWRHRQDYQKNLIALPWWYEAAA